MDPTVATLHAIDPTTEPAVAVATWLLLSVARSLLPNADAMLRRVAPMIAVLLAVGLQAGLAAASGGEVTFGTVLRGIVAGALAVLGHSQFREIVKAVQEKKSQDPPTKT